jgi:Cytochrome c
MLTGCPSPPQNTLEQEPLYQSGQALFSNRCAACHGMQGEGASMLLEGKNIHFKLLPPVEAICPPLISHPKKKKPWSFLFATCLRPLLKNKTIIPL